LREAISEKTLVPPPLSLHIRNPIKPPPDAEHLREFVDQVILVTRSQGIGPRGPVIVEAAVEIW